MINNKIMQDVAVAERVEGVIFVCAFSLDVCSFAIEECGSDNLHIFTHRAYLNIFSHFYYFVFYALDMNNNMKHRALSHKGF